MWNRSGFKYFYISLSYRLMACDKINWLVLSNILPGAFFMCLSKFSEEKISYIKMLIDKLSYSQRVYLSVSEKIIFLTMPIVRLFVSCRYNVVKGLCSTFFLNLRKIIEICHWTLRIRLTQKHFVIWNVHILNCNYL